MEYFKQSNSKKRICILLFMNISKYQRNNHCFFSRIFSVVNIVKDVVHFWPTLYIQCAMWDVIYYLSHDGRVETARL